MLLISRTNVLWESLVSHSCTTSFLRNLTHVMLVAPATVPPSNAAFVDASASSLFSCTFAASAPHCSERCVYCKRERVAIKQPMCVFWF